MKTTNKTPKMPKMPVAQRRALCAHVQTIELLDGVKVCTCCEAVLQPSKDA